MQFKAFALALMVTVAAGTVAAAEIYKWTDEEGTIHYGDKPSGLASEQLLAIHSQPTDPSKIQAQVQARLQVKDEADEAAASAPPRPTRDEIRAEREKREKECATAEERYKRYSEARRLYREDEGGDRVYLDSAEIDAARDKAEQDVKQHCR